MATAWLSRTTGEGSRPREQRRIGATICSQSVSAHDGLRRVAGGDRRLELVAAGPPQRGGPLEHGSRRRRSAAWSQRDRSWSAQQHQSPCSSNRAAARACWMVSSAASPQASGSSGRRSRPRRPARPRRRRGRGPGWRRRGDEPLVEHHVDDRQHVVEPLVQLVRRGTVSEMPASTILRLARTIRWASVRLVDQEGPGDLRGRQADDGAQGERQPGLGGQRRVAAGEEQREPVVGRRRRTRLDARRRAGAPSGQAPPACAAADAVEGVALRRRPAARPPGLSGGPSRRHAPRASTTADCTASSARSKSPNRRAAGPRADRPPRAGSARGGRPYVADQPRCVTRTGE